MQALTIAWHSDLTAIAAVQQALPQDIADSIIRDLDNNNPEIGIAWHDEQIEQHSGVGGVGNLEWVIPDRSVLTVVYENAQTTHQQIDLSSGWMLENSHIN